MRGSQPSSRGSQWREGVSVDADYFDALARVLSTTPSRRGVLLLLGGVGIGVAPSAGQAKRKRKKKRKHANDCPSSLPVRCPPTAGTTTVCYPPGDVCCPATTGGGACPPTHPACCPPTPQRPDGACCPQAYPTCCPLGGCCPSDYPQCCPPTVDSPEGTCAPAGDVCCPASAGGGACPPTHPTCCPPSPDFPEGSCAAPGVPCSSAVRSGAEDRGLRDRQGVVGRSSQQRAFQDRRESASRSSRQRVSKASSDRRLTDSGLGHPARGRRVVFSLHRPMQRTRIGTRMPAPFPEGSSTMRREGSRGRSDR